MKVILKNTNNIMVNPIYHKVIMNTEFEVEKSKVNGFYEVISPLFIKFGKKDKINLSLIKIDNCDIIKEL